MRSVRKSKRGGRKNTAKAQTASTPDEVPHVELQQRATQAAQRAMALATSAFPSFEQLQARTGKFFARVEKKLEQVPDDRRQPAPPTIAAPAAFQYALLGEGPDVADLREMFENLLAASMDSETAHSAHPAFVSMISQLTPDEARIVKSVDRDDYALTTLRARNSEGYAAERLGFRTTLGRELGFDVERQQQCISNLVRLGILRFDDMSSTATQRNSLNHAIDVEFAGQLLDRVGGSIEVTPLGRRFLDTCVGKRNAPLHRS